MTDEERKKLASERNKNKGGLFNALGTLFGVDDKKPEETQTD